MEDPETFRPGQQSAQKHRRLDESVSRHDAETGSVVSSDSVHRLGLHLSPDSVLEDMSPSPEADADSPKWN